MTGLLPRWTSPLVGALIAVTLVTSLVAAIAARLGVDVYGALALVPSEVWRGQVWRLVTWAVVEASAFNLIVGCVALFWFGAPLSARWGSRRFAGYVAGIVVVAGAGTTLLALVMREAWHLPHLGGLALTDALVVAWALTFPTRTIRLYGVLELGGVQLAHATIAVTLIYAVFYGVAPLLPELLAGLAALVHADGELERAWRRLRAAVVRARARRRGLRAVDGGRHGGPYGPN